MSRYPGFELETGDPSKVVKLLPSTTEIILVLSWIAAVNLVGFTSLMKFSNMTLFVLECIPWFLWSISIVEPSLIWSVTTETIFGIVTPTPELLK